MKSQIKNHWFNNNKKKKKIISNTVEMNPARKRKKVEKNYHPPPAKYLHSKEILESIWTMPRSVLYALVMFDKF